MRDRELFIRCGCGSPEHQFVLSYIPSVWSPEERDPDRLTAEMYLEAHLNTWHNVFRRIWTALKYVVGYKCRHGQWDEVVLSVMDVIRMKKFLESFLEEI